MQLERRIKRRQFLVLIVMSFLWIGLLARLWWIQLGAPHHFSRRGIDLIRASVKQRQQSIILHSGRGDIFDRNGYAFTGVEHPALILFPLAKGSLEGTDTLERLANIVGEPSARLSETMKNARAPVVFRDRQNNPLVLTEEQMAGVNRLDIPGIVAVRVTERYRQEEVAKHVIGYIHQNPQLVESLYPEEWASGKMNGDSTIGAAGLERSFDRFLQGVEPIVLSYYVDGMGRPLRGLDIRYTRQENEYYPLSLTTTLDVQIQRNMEIVAEETGIREGSIVVLDAKNGDVLAMVSRPEYDQKKVDVSSGNWQNRALKQIPPGSVFKTVVAAAALAEGLVLPTDRFLCTGEYGKYRFSCWKKGGHGSVTMEEAFAQSCNIAFAEIAKRVGGKKIEEYAKRLGLSMQVGHVTPQLFKQRTFKQLDGEERGAIFSREAAGVDEGTLIQTAIGQRDVRVTPLQAANLMVTILRGGKPGQVRMVERISYRSGQPFYRFPEQELAAEGIDYVTANKLRKMLRKVVTEGTGNMLDDRNWQIAGKSGTAQTGTTHSGNHLWFAGFAPYDNPRYAICVVVENQPSWVTGKALEVFSRAVAALETHTAKDSPPRAVDFRG